jgi:S-adenosylmethionine:tRNA ribosyltransferase-isomerase
VKTSSFDYHLPEEFIAQTPVEPRDSARLLVMDRDSGQIQHAIFRDLGSYLNLGDLLVLNETRVIPARLFANKIPGGGRAELLLLNRRDARTWEVLIGGKGLREGVQVQVQGGPQAEVIMELEGALRLVRFSEPIDAYLDKAGHMPLPPYIRFSLEDRERYQTVYARSPGSAAAPTAGLHFTPGLIRELSEAGIRMATLTLHVGLDTFVPVSEASPEEHTIHTEWCKLDFNAAELVNQTHQEGGRIIAVGTTSVRTLETAAAQAVSGERVSPYEGPTSLFILPGYRFKAVDALITNFHLPRSTLIMLVSAFAGKELTMYAYETAKQEGYRFYSFGDVMLIL